MGGMTTLTVTARSPRDLLAYVPYGLGYRPRSSAVVVGLRPPRSRVGLMVRADLGDLVDPARGRILARTVARHHERDGAEALVVIVYCDELDDAAREAFDVLEHELGVVAPVRGRWVVTASGWFDPGCTDPACCPPGGRPLASLDASPVAAELVLAGVGRAASRDHAYALPRADETARRAARRSAARWRARPDRTPAAGLAQWRAAVRDAAAGCPVGAPRLGRVLAALEDLEVRDAALLTLVPGSGDLAERLVADGAGGHDARVVEALARIVDPGGVAPDDAVLEPARQVLVAAAAHATGRALAPALTLLGVLAWWEGDGGLARARVDAALRAAPDHRLALLFRDALDAGLPPGWVRAPDRTLG